MPYLQYQGIKKIDTLVLSHNNLDHTGGAQYLIENIPINKVISGEAITGLNIIDRCKSGQNWQWDAVDFKILYPYQENTKNSNDNSCVLKISAGTQSILLTGDIEKQGENWLVQHAALDLKTTILLAPHHGSRTSSTKSFVELTDPEHVIFSTGYLNRYQFPRADIVEKYTQLGAKVYNTAVDGAINLKISNTSLD